MDSFDLAQRLAVFAQHGPLCASRLGADRRTHGPCNCGLDILLEEEVQQRTWRPGDKLSVQVSTYDMLAVLKERLALRSQVMELQARMTEMVSNTLARQVRAFHAKFGHPIATTPHVPDDKTMRFRLRLVREEFFELLAACGVKPSYVGEQVEVFAEDIVQEAIDTAPLTVDFVEVIDALHDMDYINEGTRVVCGVDNHAVAMEVQRANMAKDANGPDGKPAKPPGWTPPDIASVLLAQGWRPKWTPPADAPLKGMKT